jgi:tetratricopeptide (TPR) repeat protein
MKVIQFLWIILAFVVLSSCRNNQGSGIGTVSSDEELASLNAQIAKNDKDASLYLKRAGIFFNRQLLNDALADLNKVLELEPKSTPGYLLLSKVYILMGKPQQALESLNVACNLDPGSMEAFLEKAKLYLVMKDYENCAVAVDKVLELDNRNADAYYIRGVALDENGEAAKAVEAFRLAVTSDPGHYDALMQLGYAFSESNPSMAIDYFSNAVKADTSSIEALYNLGMLLQENEKQDRALEIYDKILRIEPTNKLALYNSGYVNLVYEKEFSKAADFFSRAITIDSAYTDAYYNRGYAYELNGDIQKARKDYERVLQLRVNDPKAVGGLNRLDRAAR